LNINVENNKEKWFQKYKHIFETANDVYGFFDASKQKFYRYDDKNIKSINCIFGKDTKKVYLI